MPQKPYAALNNFLSLTNKSERIKPTYQIRLKSRDSLNKINELNDVIEFKNEQLNTRNEQIKYLVSYITSNIYPDFKFNKYKDYRGRKIK